MDNIAGMKESFIKIIREHLSSMEFTETEWSFIRSKIVELEKRYGVVGDRLIKIEGILQELAAAQRRSEERLSRLEAVVEELAAAQRRSEERVEELAVAQKRTDNSVSRLARTVDGIGARWGILSEDAFQNGLRGVLQDALGWKVEKWRTEDKEGKVYYVPSPVEIDIVVHDGKKILLEIKSSVSYGDLSAFKRVTELYEAVEGSVDRKVLITPYISEPVIAMANHLGIEVFRAQDL